jgi:membrane-bound serine protease (ClpP class)
MGTHDVIGLQRLVAGLSPDAAVVLFTLGIGLIYYEFNRPGSIVPGCLGLLTVLLSLAAVGQHGVNPVAVALILSGVALLTLTLLRPTPMLLSLAATVALVAGLRWLPKFNCCMAVHTAVATSCGVALGAGTSVLTRIARRARINKGLDY